MPIHHIVLFKLKPSLTEAKKDSFLPLCQEGLAKVPYGTEQVMGPPLSAALTQGFEYALYRKLKDVEELTAYRTHPEHQKLITGIVAERVESMVSFQLQG